MSVEPVVVDASVVVRHICCYATVWVNRLNQYDTVVISFSTVDSAVFLALAASVSPVEFVGSGL